MIQKTEYPVIGGRLGLLVITVVRGSGSQVVLSSKLGCGTCLFCGFFAFFTLRNVHMVSSFVSAMRVLIPKFHLYFNHLDCLFLRLITTGSPFNYHTNLLGPSLKITTSSPLNSTGLNFFFFMSKIEICTLSRLFGNQCYWVVLKIQALLLYWEGFP